MALDAQAAAFVYIYARITQIAEMTLGFHVTIRAIINHQVIESRGIKIVLSTRPPLRHNFNADYKRCRQDSHRPESLFVFRQVSKHLDYVMAWIQAQVPAEQEALRLLYILAGGFL